MMEKPITGSGGGGGAPVPGSTKPPETPAPTPKKSKPDYVLWVGVAIVIALLIYLGVR